MPDNDIVPRGIPKAWKKAAELAVGGKEPQLVADECGRALAAELREAQCANAVFELSGRLDEAILLGRPEIYANAAALFLDSLGASPLSSAVVAEGNRLLETPEGSGRPIAEVLLAGALRRLGEASLFGSEAMLKRMHKKAGLSLEELDSYSKSILDAVPVQDLVDRLVRSPDGEIRAPTRRATATTEEMLNEPIT